MDPAQAPTVTSNPQTGVTAATPARLGAPLAVPSPDLATDLLPNLRQNASPDPLPSNGPVAHRPGNTASSLENAALPRPALLAAWPRSAQVTTALLLCMVAALLGLHYYSATRDGSRPTDLERLHDNAYRVDLNRAPLAELEQLPGVGPQRAARIDAYRRQHGGFRSVEELRKVHGFGVITLEGLRDLVTVSAAEHEEDRAPRLASPAKIAKQRTRPGKKELALRGTVIDVNRASRAELQRLPGVGPKMSQRILDERARGRFKTVDDLRRVAGIGAKTLDRLRPYVSMGDGPQIAAAERD